MHLEKKINIPTLLCIACRASPATGIYTNDLVHAPLCYECSTKTDDSIITLIMETENAVCASMRERVRSWLSGQSRSRHPGRGQSKQMQP